MNSPFFIALKNNFFDIAEDLLLFGSNLNAKKSNGQGIFKYLVF
jgi:hypothetical protein